ncbi:MAG: signal peptidase I [Clostridia bacterium]|nr:signal peptidase I [Clostridia bacterium]
MTDNEKDVAREFPSAEDLRTEIKRENYKQKYKKILRSTVYALVVVAAVAVLIATLVLPVVQITGTSMDPTLTEGDIVVLVKSSQLKRGDLCAFSYSNRTLIKRVIGLPGDYIEIDAEGNVFVNGEQLDEPYVINKSLGECDIEFPYQVPESAYFMLGDHRDTSIDSRSTVIGCITDEQLIGKIVFRVWPFKDISFID